MTEKKSLVHAGLAAMSLQNRLEHYCQRIEIAGSIRRKKAMVKDIELVAIPKLTTVMEDMFGDANDTKIWEGRRLIDEIASAILKDGPRYIQFVLPPPEDMVVDLFLANRENWGVQFAIRTGPWEFSKALVSSISEGGYRPPDFKFKDGFLWQRVAGIWKKVPVAEEMDLFALFGMDWISPENRQ